MCLKAENQLFLIFFLHSAGSFWAAPLKPPLILVFEFSKLYLFRILAQLGTLASIVLNKLLGNAILLSAQQRIKEFHSKLQGERVSILES